MNTYSALAAVLVRLQPIITARVAGGYYIGTAEEEKYPYVVATMDSIGAVEYNTGSRSGEGSEMEDLLYAFDVFSTAMLDAAQTADLLEHALTTDNGPPMISGDVHILVAYTMGKDDGQEETKHGGRDAGSHIWHASRTIRLTIDRSL